MLMDYGIWNLLENTPLLWYLLYVALICIANYEDRRKTVAFTRSMLDA